MGTTLVGKTNGASLQVFYNNLKNTAMAYTTQFVIQFDTFPYQEASQAGECSLTYYVKSASIPQVSIKQQEIPFLGQKFIVPKNVQYQHTWNVGLLMTQGMQQYTALYKWQNYLASMKNNGGGEKKIPNTTATVRMLDSTMQNTTRVFKLVGIFPSNIPDIDMQYENQATPAEVQITFTYQYMYDETYEQKDPLLVGN